MPTVLRGRPEAPPFVVNVGVLVPTRSRAAAFALGALAGLALGVLLAPRR